MAIDGSESELGILDLIQVLVETLDRHFKNVCELDLIFNSERVCLSIDHLCIDCLCTCGYGWRGGEGGGTSASST